MTKNRTPTPVYLDPGMHPGLEVKGLILLFRCKEKERHLQLIQSRHNQLLIRVDESEKRAKVAEEKSEAYEVIISILNIYT